MTKKKKNTKKVEPQIKKEVQDGIQIMDESVKKKKEPIYGILDYGMTYVRSNASKTGRIISIISRNTRMILLTPDKDGWTRVRIDDTSKTSGYVQTAFIRKE